MTPAFAAFPALGSNAVVGVTEPDRLDDAREAVQRTVDAFDVACSRFRDDSELSAVNRSAGTWTQVGPVLLDATSAALRAARLTDGDVDPTVGAALIALGYDRDFDELGTATPTPPRIVAVPGWRTVTVDHERSAVRLGRGVRLDLGATAKALAADQAAAAAERAAGCGILVGLGGDIALAGPPPGHGWPVRVTDDHRAGAGAAGQWIRLHTGGLATSSTTVRRWATAGGEMHHLVDPATGRPAGTPWRTVTVAAATCLDANIATTAAIIRGDRAESWLRSLGLPARLVDEGGRARHLAGWPAAGDDCAGSSAPVATREPRLVEAAR